MEINKRIQLQKYTHGYVLINISYVHALYGSSLCSKYVSISLFNRSIVIYL